MLLKRCDECGATMHIGLSDDNSMWVHRCQRCSAIAEVVPATEDLVTEYKYERRRLEEIRLLRLKHTEQEFGMRLMELEESIMEKAGLTESPCGCWDSADGKFHLICERHMQESKYEQQ